MTGSYISVVSEQIAPLQILFQVESSMSASLEPIIYMPQCMHSSETKAMLSLSGPDGMYGHSQ